MNNGENVLGRCIKLNKSNSRRMFFYEKNYSNV